MNIYYSLNNPDKLINTIIRNDMLDVFKYLIDVLEEADIKHPPVSVPIRDVGPRIFFYMYRNKISYQ